jgi:hypothetical protein
MKEGDSKMGPPKMTIQTHFAVNKKKVAGYAKIYGAGNLASA